MKLSKIIVLILAIACAVTMLSSCDMEDIENLFNGEKSPETPREYYEYAYDYMMTHAYKQTVVSTVKMNDEIYSGDSEVSYMDGANYCTGDNGINFIYYDGTIYADRPDGKRKMDIDFEAEGESLGLTKDYFNSVDDSLTDESIKLTKNDDGTATLEFSVTVPYVGECDFVVTLDKDNRIVKYVMTNDMTVMGYHATTIDEVTIEYGDQYKVTPPEDPDSYETVDSYYDLVL